MGSNIRLNAVTLATLAVAALLTGTAAQSCPSDLCQDHTLCLYPGIGDACNEVVARGLSEDQKEAAVAAHNRLRDYLASGQEQRGSPGPQPAAADMLKQEWDEELAVVAQRWADQCTFRHDDCRADARFSNVGQNIYMLISGSPSQEINWDAAAQAWYDEVDFFNSSYVEKYLHGSPWGHYTALVWGNSRYVGCGFTEFQKDGNYYVLLVCNYGPAGNIECDPVYEAGPSCSNCPSGCDTTYTSLCS